ncbi:hypothetical protein LWI29_031627 [Acer saccharum]|uniref:Uncharacterized protein n=1 Tax=Acer saccharum TaxID=4024 RepID=A0AA39SKZ7_ACESA|nr:hypothetical protein LWI29_031627 [Acer saccharum]
MVEQTTQISIGWLSNHLKVKPYGSNLNNCVNKDDFGLFSEKTSREACPVEDSGNDRCREGVEKDVSDLIRVEKKFRKVVREQVSKNIRQNGEATFGSGVGKEKGKSVWIPSRKTIIQAPGGNGSIRFKSQSGLYGGKRWDRMDSSTSSSDPEVRPKGASVQRLYSAPALFSRANRGALYVERFVERLYNARTATKLN